MKIGTIIDKLYDLRAEKYALIKQIQALSDEMEHLEATLLSKLVNEEAIKASGNKASVTITSTVVPVVADWDEVYKFAVEQDACYIFEKRISTSAFRELQQMGTTIPGTSSFEKKSLSLRKL